MLQTSVASSATVFLYNAVTHPLCCVTYLPLFLVTCTLPRRSEICGGMHPDGSDKYRNRPSVSDETVSRPGLVGRPAPRGR